MNNGCEVDHTTMIRTIYRMSHRAGDDSECSTWIMLYPRFFHKVRHAYSGINQFHMQTNWSTLTAGRMDHSREISVCGVDIRFPKKDGAEAAAQSYAKYTQVGSKCLEAGAKRCELSL